MARKQDLIAYCGLYCGDCFGYKGTVADLARDLRKELRSYRFDLMADALSEVPIFKEFKDYEKCYNLLGTMVKFRCKRTCKGNGGPPNCKIRNCVRKKKLDGCWQCEEFSTCESSKNKARPPSSKAKSTGTHRNSISHSWLNCISKANKALIHIINKPSINFSNNY